MKKEIKCPHCGDTWEYKFIVDHENGCALVSTDFNFIEEHSSCICYKCHKTYTPKFNKPEVYMYDFVYNAWRRTKNS